MTEITMQDIQSHNPWFGRPEYILEDTYIEEFERQKYRYYHPLLKTFPLGQDALLTLRGPRRVGKSTLLKLLIKDLLLKHKVERERVFFFPCDRLEHFNDLYALLKEYLNYIRPKTDERIYLFLDEISFVKDWPRGIKELLDAGKLKKATLLLTGSSILDLKYSGERLPGRRGEICPLDITFLPLTFCEYVSLLKPELSKLSFKEAVNHLAQYRKLFAEYLITGGFPLTINQYMDKGYIPADIYETYLSWIEGDLHKAGKSEEIAYRLLEHIFKTLTTPISYYKLTKEAAIASHATTEDYLDILEKLFILFKAEYFNIDQRKADYKKNRKFYFFDPFILFALKAKIEGFSQSGFDYAKSQIAGSLPALIENTAAAHLKRFYPDFYYGRSMDYEIDFVGKTKGELFFFEVKYQKKVAEKDFIWFSSKWKKPLTVLTKNDLRQNHISLIPSELFLALSPTLK